MALSADKEVLKSVGDLSSDILLEDSVTVYKGAMVVVETAGGNQGYAKPATDAANLTFIGVAYEQGDNASGADGAVGVRCELEGIYEFKKTSAAQTDVGKTAYAVDDETVATTTTNSVKVGKIVEYIDSTHVRVKINTVVI